MAVRGIALSNSLYFVYTFLFTYLEKKFISWKLSNEVPCINSGNTFTRHNYTKVAGHLASSFLPRI